jgi:hypothetical protein
VTRHYGVYAHRHTSRIANAVLARVLQLLGPTRYDPNLKRFANFPELNGP